MLIKASEKDRSILLDYCKTEPVFNIFIIGDIENFGFSSSDQDVWYERHGEKIRGLALRYHDNLIVYSQELDMDFALIGQILDDYNINIISGKGLVIDRVEKQLKEWTSRKNLNFCRHVDGSSLAEPGQGIVLARLDQAMDIALAYGDIEEFEDLYSNDVNERYKQIASRIKSGEGKHIMIVDRKGILAHGNTSAENSLSGMIGGIFTRKDMRSRGYGRQIISSLVGDLKARNKEVALFYKNEKEGRLFKSLGFEEIGVWSILRREKDE